MLALAAGTFAHLILDEMWQVPVTLFWPLLGFSFPVEDLENWASDIWNALLIRPACLRSGNRRTGDIACSLLAAGQEKKGPGFYQAWRSCLAFIFLSKWYRLPTSLYMFGGIWEI